MSATTVTAPDGARVEVQGIGAQVTSWIPAGGEEQLFVAANSRPGERCVKGGVPVMFPQFADLGPLPSHGFARDLVWVPAGEMTAGSNRRASFVLELPEGWGQRWPHPVTLELTVAVGGPTLAVTLNAHNRGGRTWYFTGGLHTYFKLADLGQVTLEGLSGRSYKDKTRDGAIITQTDELLTVTEETDRVYLEVGGPLVLREPGRKITIAQSGFPDAVVWNPWLGAEKRFPDLSADDYRHMICVEATAIGQPPTLGPGQHWSGTQTLTWSAT